MPKVHGQFQDAKTAALKKIETSRTKRSRLFWNFLKAKELNIDYDINKSIYDKIEKMSIKDLDDFFNQNIKDRYYTFLVIGNKDLLNIETLQNLGDYQELSLEQVFGY